MEAREEYGSVPKPKSSVPLRIAGKTTPKPATPHPAENMFVEDLTSVPEQAHWNCVRKEKIHVLEIFAGSARFSQCCALSGVTVGTPVDIRTGFDAMTSKGRHTVMEIIKEQAPDESSWQRSVDHKAVLPQKSRRRKVLRGAPLEKVALHNLGTHSKHMSMTAQACC